MVGITQGAKVSVEDLEKERLEVVEAGLALKN